MAGAKAKADWLMAVTSATTVPTSAGWNSLWAIKGGSDTRSTHTQAEQRTARRQRPHAFAERQQHRPNCLHQEIVRGHETSIAIAHQPSQQGASQHSTEGAQADRRCREHHSAVGLEPR